MKAFDPHHTDPTQNALIEKMPNIRVFYSKTGPAKYISHLDIARCMQRSLKRAGIPVWYTQGYNPHMYMSFALPLSLGYESGCEAMDLRITEWMEPDEVQTRLNQALPRDLRVLKVTLQQHKPQEITYADYQITFTCADGEGFCTAMRAFYDQPEILVQKKTKKGMKTVDIKPDIEIKHLSATESGAICTMRTAAGQRNINPSLFTDLLIEQCDQTVVVAIYRRKLLDQNQKLWK